MSKDTRGGGGVKPVQQKSKVELLFSPCGFPYLNSEKKVISKVIVHTVSCETIDRTCVQIIGVV